MKRLKNGGAQSVPLRTARIGALLPANSWTTSETWQALADHFDYHFASKGR
jgi:hypothetical protein